jgi:uncharacterized ParB-like nuclease family protein
MTDLGQARNRQELVDAWSKDSELVKLPLSEIRTFMQPRVDGTDDETLESYVQSIQIGTTFPPVDVFLVDGEHILVDGYHRYFASKRKNQRNIKARVFKNRSRQEAEVYGSFANITNGKSMAPIDLDHAIRGLLEVDSMRDRFVDGFKLKTQAIADWAGVSRSTVYNVTSMIRAMLEHEEFCAIQEMKADGKTDTAIARELGMDRKTVKKKASGEKFQGGKNTHQGIKGIPKVETDLRLDSMQGHGAKLSDQLGRESCPKAIMFGLSYLSVGSGMDKGSNPNLEETIEYIESLDYDTQLLALRDIKAATSYLEKLTESLKEKGVIVDRRYPSSLPHR